MKAANKQPFYHRLEVTFTATSDVAERFDDHGRRDRFEAALRNLIVKYGGKTVIGDSVFIEGCDAEPGDPADLVG